MRGLVLASVLVILAAAPASAADPPAGDYLCRVDEEAGVASTHLEGAPPPAGYKAKPRTRFKMRVSVILARGSKGKASYRAAELPYDGPDRDKVEWHTPNSVLHSAYVGTEKDGVASLTAVEDQGFLRFAANSETRALWFYHSGFQYPGSVDVGLAVRYGTCQPVKK